MYVFFVPEIYFYISFFRSDCFGVIVEHQAPDAIAQCG